jgi:hypothetical protein
MRRAGFFGEEERRSDPTAVLATLLSLLLVRRVVHDATFLAWWFSDILP